MLLKLWFGKTFVEGDKSTLLIDCPNAFGGIGDISLIPKLYIWTGDCHIKVDGRIYIHFANITCIEFAREDIGEETVWEILETVDTARKFTYTYYFNLAKKILSL